MVTRVLGGRSVNVSESMHNGIGLVATHPPHGAQGVEYPLMMGKGKKKRATITAALPTIPDKHH